MWFGVLLLKFQGCLKKNFSALHFTVFPKIYLGEIWIDRNYGDEFDANTGAYDIQSLMFTMYIALFFYLHSSTGNFENSVL